MAEISKDDLARALNVETAEVERLRAINAELLAALELALPIVHAALMQDTRDEHGRTWLAVRDAIAKAKGAAA